MDKVKIAEEICQAVAKQLRRSDVTPDKKLKEDLNADSLDVVELLMGLEEKYNLTIPDEKLDEMQTINDVAEYIVSALSK